MADNKETKKEIAALLGRRQRLFDDLCVVEGQIINHLVFLLEDNLGCKVTLSYVDEGPPMIKLTGVGPDKVCDTEDRAWEIARGVDISEDIVVIAVEETGEGAEGYA